MSRSLVLSLGLSMFFCLLLHGQMNENRDCSRAIVLCSDDDVSINPDGIGENDFLNPNNDNGCLRDEENNSAWYYFEISEEAPNDLELGFTIDPFGGPAEDYDFALWGPDVDCNDLGSPLRCSFAGDFCIFCPQTGLGMGATDISEDVDGDGFVSMITVQPGEGYFLLLDNYLGSSMGFNLTWTGSAAPWLNCEADPTCELVLTLEDDYTYCQGDGPFDLNLEVDGNSDSYTFDWSGSNGGTAFLSDTTIQTPTVTIPTDFQGDIVYTVEVTSSDMECIDTADVVVTVNPVPIVSIDSLQDLCLQGDPIQLIGSPVGGTWSESVGVDGVFDPEIYGPGSHSFSYSFTDENGCTGMITESINVIENPEANAGEGGELNCSTDAVLLGAEAEDGLSYEWTLDGVVVGTTAQIEVNAPGEYILTVTSDGLCTDMDQAVVTAEDDIIEELVLDISNPSCNGSMDGSILLEQIVGGVEPYEVFLNGEMVSETLFNGLSAGTYDLEVIDANGCGFIDTVEINDPEEFTVDLGEDVNLEQGDSVTLTLSVLSGVLDSADWFVNGELVCSGCNEYVYNAISTASISVQAYNPEGCLSEDNIQIIVEVKRRFYIPNVFSPNFDGLNDIFYVHGAEEVERVVSLQVFNRWGAMVFSAQNIAPGISEMGWNGTYKGEILNPGVYIYNAELLFRDGATINKSGDITLVR